MYGTMLSRLRFLSLCHRLLLSQSLNRNQFHSHSLNQPRLSDPLVSVLRWDRIIATNDRMGRLFVIIVGVHPLSCTLHA